MTIALMRSVLSSYVGYEQSDTAKLWGATVGLPNRAFGTAGQASSGTQLHTTRVSD